MSVQSRPSRFSIAAGVSAALFVVGCGVAWHRFSTRIIQAERIYRESEDIDDVARVLRSLSYEDTVEFLAPWWYAEHNARMAMLELAADNYQRHRDAILAAEHRRDVIAPLVILGLLGALPLVWLCIAVRQLEKRLAAGAKPPESLWARLYLRSTVGLAVVAFISGMVLLALVRRGNRTADEFRQILIYDEGQHAVNRETWVTTSHGWIGITIFWRPLHGVTAAQVRQLSNTPDRWLPEHLTHAAGPMQFAVPQQQMWGLLGVTWGSWDSHSYPGEPPARRPSSYAAQLVFPLWPLALLLIVGGLGLWVYRRPLRRFRAGHCRGCGYDLTGNVSGVCPECGADVDEGRC